MDLKKQIENAVSVFDGQTMRFYADADCRKYVCAGVLPTPAFGIDEDFIPRLAGYEPHVPKYGPAGAQQSTRVAFAKFGQGAAIKVEKRDGVEQPLIVYVDDCDVPLGGNVSAVSCHFKVGQGDEDGGAELPPGFVRKVVAAVTVIKKADKDAAFARVRAAVPPEISDDAIRAYTEHGKPVQQAIGELTAAAQIPDADPDPWLDPEQPEAPGA